MLVLTRKCGTEVVIDGRIRVTVLEVRGGQVRLGISAPAAVPVFRQELVTGPEPGQAGRTQGPTTDPKAQ